MPTILTIFIFTLLLYQQPAPTGLRPVGHTPAGNTEKVTIPASGAMDTSGATVPAPTANSVDRNPSRPSAVTGESPTDNDTPFAITSPSLPIPEPDILGSILVLVAAFGLCCSFFFIYQSLHLQKALFPTRKHRFLNPEAIGLLPVAYFFITITVWLAYIWTVNIDYIRDYDIQGRFYLYHPRLLLMGLLVGNLFPSSIALYASYLLHYKSKAGKDSSTKEVTKRASIFSLVFNLINLIASIVTIFIFASTK